MSSSAPLTARFEKTRDTSVPSHEAASHVNGRACGLTVAIGCDLVREMRGHCRKPHFVPLSGMSTWSETQHQVPDVNVGQTIHVVPNAPHQRGIARDGRQFLQLLVEGPAGT